MFEKEESRKHRDDILLTPELFDMYESLMSFKEHWVKVHYCMFKIQNSISKDEINYLINLMNNSNKLLDFYEEKADKAISVAMSKGYSTDIIDILAESAQLNGEKIFLNYDLPKINERISKPANDIKEFADYLDALEELKTSRNIIS